MQLNASKMREIVSGILGRVLKAGTASVSLRTSREEGNVPVHAASKLSRLVRRDYLRCDPESIIHLDWSDDAVGTE
jgi:hypothetical protein